MSQPSPSVAIVGSGIIGIACAYYLSRNHGLRNLVLIDRGAPMAFTSAQSGENYRNWWPSGLMTRFTDRSIDLMEEIARTSENRIAMTRRGYLLASRAPDLDAAVKQLQANGMGNKLRNHGQGSTAYRPPLSADWQAAPDGFDLLHDPTLIRRHFPYLDPEVRTILHVRRGGDISGQQLGQFMLDDLRDSGLRRITAEVVGISAGDGFTIRLDTGDSIRADRLVNAAGPFAPELARMLDVSLPVFNVLQQKIAFPDAERAIPRDMPFTIDLDPQQIGWTPEDRALLAADPDAAFLAGMMPGAIHCRPDGGDRGSWVKLGWAYNEAPQAAAWDVPLDPRFPEIVLRGAARMNPGLRRYYGKLPRHMHHYGGWYTRTADNWPLIGPMGPEGAYMACGLSGHGTMAACATGELLAAWIAGTELPDYAEPFSLARYATGAEAPEAHETGLL